MPFCKHCDKHYHEGYQHACPPLWEARVFETKWQNEWHEVHGNDPEQAAARFCEIYDRNGDYDIVRRGGDEIEVRKPGDDEIIMVDVSAESVPHYYGHVRKPKPEAAPATAIPG